MGKVLKTSEILTRAKKRLWDGVNAAGTPYICVAAEEVSTSSRSKRLRDEIANSLYPNSTLRTWLMEVVGVPHEQLTSENVQRHRLQWMDRMIKEYKAKGD